MKVTLKNIEYEIISNDRDCFNKEDIEKLLEETDYFDTYDYILGDYSYEKLRLKGFREDKGKNTTEINNIKNLDNYIKNYCNTNAKTFLIKKDCKNK